MILSIYKQLRIWWIITKREYYYNKLDKINQEIDVLNPAYFKDSFQYKMKILKLSKKRKKILKKLIIKKL